MPKVLMFTTAKSIWTFLFYGTDANENRAHIHVGKKGTEVFAKIWLEPSVELAKQGDLTEAHGNSRGKKGASAKAMAGIQKRREC